MYFYYSNFTIIFNFAQNLQLSHFKKEQLDDAYYFSSLSLYAFGIVDHSPETHYLRGFLCYKGKGKKGANNVASLIK